MADQRRPIRTLVVEDSPTVRHLLVEILSSDPDFQVVGEAADGAEGVNKAIELSPDLITMDVQMPVLDGIDATKAIMREAPTPILVVSAAASRGDVHLALNAMQAGALMVVDKPDDPNSPRFAQQTAQLRDMAKAMSGVKVVRRWGSDVPFRRSRSTSRPMHTAQIVAIGASTGGPAALRTILVSLPAGFSAPILIVQHISHGFIEGLVRWLNLDCPVKIKVARDGEKLVAGSAYMAPDNQHLGVSSDGRIQLSESPPIGGFRPSIDYLFSSCARAYRGDMAAVILTGMGRDGADGLRVVHDAGGRVLAQDELTSVVYGMAQEAVRGGVVDEILPIDAIAGRLVELAS